MKKPAPQLSRLFKTDDVGWMEENAKLIKKGKFDELDYPHLKIYLQDMADWDKRETYSKLFRVMAELLRWQAQPERRKGPWKAAILFLRHDLKDLVDSPTLMHFAEKSLKDAYLDAVYVAAAATGLKEEDFPGHCPFTLDYLLGKDLPEESLED